MQKRILKPALMATALLLVAAICFSGHYTARPDGLGPPVTMQGRGLPGIKLPPAHCEIITFTYWIEDDVITAIQAGVRNSGGVGDKYEISLSLDGEVLAARSVSVAARSLESVLFECCVQKGSGQAIEMEGLSIPLDHLFMISFVNPQMMPVSSYRTPAGPGPEPRFSVRLPPLPADPPNTPAASRIFDWSFNGIKWQWQIDVPLSVYRTAVSSPRPLEDNFSRYISSPYEDIFLGDIARQLYHTASENGYSYLERVQFTAGFVQAFIYISDVESTGFANYARYPVETLMDLRGDCEDSSLLLAALLDRMGEDVVFVAFPDHLGIGIAGGPETSGTFWPYDGIEYFYLETTVSGWKIGESPQYLQGVEAIIYPLN
jgi:hypothetical protein